MTKLQHVVENAKKKYFLYCNLLHNIIFLKTYTVYTWNIWMLPPFNNVCLQWQKAEILILSYWTFIVCIATFRSLIMFYLYDALDYSLHLNTQRNHTGLILVMCIRVTYAKSMILWPDIPVMPVSSSTTCRTNQLKLSLFISLMMFQTCLLFLHGTIKLNV